MIILEWDTKSLCCQRPPLHMTQKVLRQLKPLHTTKRGEIILLMFVSFKVSWLISISCLTFISVSVSMDHKDFASGLQLLWNQITAMFMKKYLYSIRNYIFIIVQIIIPALFVAITILDDVAGFSFDDNNLPALTISLNQYKETVTTVQQGSITSGSIIEGIFTTFGRLVNEHSTLRITTNDFQDEILDNYRSSIYETNLKYMIGATFSPSEIKAWFNNEAYHTAPLAVNTINNAILR